MLMAENKTLEHLPEVRAGGDCPLPEGPETAGGSAGRKLLELRRSSSRSLRPTSTISYLNPISTI